MLSGSRNKKNGCYNHNRFNTLHHKPKVSLGFGKHSTTRITSATSQKNPPPSNEREYPKLDSKQCIIQRPHSWTISCPPPIISPIDQVLDGTWNFDSLTPHSNLSNALIKKVKGQKKEPALQFDPENDPWEVSFHQLLMVTRKLHQNQLDILENLQVHPVQ